MADPPREGGLDSTLALLRDPYRFISARCRRHGTDLFETRILLRRTVCMTGAEAAQLFYDENRFVRHGAAPQRLQKSLFGVGGVQALDDEAHRRRKGMLMSIMSRERIEGLSANFAEELERCADRWKPEEEVVLFDALHEPLLRAVCKWGGVPLANEELDRRQRDVVALFDAAGDVGPRHWMARAARRRSNRWAGDIVRRIRDGRLDPPEGSAACTIALHRDEEDRLLEPHVAAVELLNVLRPVVAVSVYIAFSAHAMHRHPGHAEPGGDEEARERFMQEVRRYYPFFPTLIARVRRDFAWRNYRFSAGQQALLDLYGTNHDERLWPQPEVFRPERFRQRDISPWELIPQGGGDVHRGHRCAGEDVTIALMKTAVKFLLDDIAYDVPEQDLRIAWSRLPALPRSRFRIRNVRSRQARPGA